MLNKHGEPESLRNWYVRKHYGAEKLWHSYLVYRVRNEVDPSVGRFVELGQVIEAVNSQGDASNSVNTEALCWLALERAAFRPGHREWWTSLNGKFPEESNPGLNLLSAAAYLGLVPLVTKLLRDGHDPTRSNLLFPSPMQCAAMAGNAAVLRLLQESLPESEDSAYGWRGKTGPGSIKGAALLGDVEMVRLAIYPPSRATPNSLDFNCQPFGTVKPGLEPWLPGFDLQRARYHTNNWHVYKFITAFFQGPMPDVSFALARNAEYGNSDMVRCLLDEGADIHGGGRLDHQPLVHAARACHEDVVDLLLDRGADPNHQKLRSCDHALTAAVAGGSLSIVRKLLDHGATAVGDGGKTLRNAVLIEHTAMLELLLARQVGDVEERPLALKAALDEGLESMAEVLVRWGVTPPLVSTCAITR